MYVVHTSAPGRAARLVTSGVTLIKAMALATVLALVVVASHEGTTSVDSSRDQVSRVATESPDQGSTDATAASGADLELASFAAPRALKVVLPAAAAYAVYLIVTFGFYAVRYAPQVVNMFNNSLVRRAGCQDLRSKRHWVGNSVFCWGT